MAPDTPLHHTQIARIVEETRRYCAVASAIYRIDVPTIPVSFDLRGLKAGMYKRLRRDRSIHYNPHIFAKYFDDSCRTTVPHEVAHYVADLLHDLKTIRPHGREWKAIMQAFGVVPERTHSYDLAEVPHRREQRHPYRCACTTHQLSSRRHNKVLARQQTYLCRRCGQPLTAATE